MVWLSETRCVVSQHISSSALWHYISAHWPAGLLAILGTFAGAWFAFLFARRHQKQLTQDADLMAGYQARFALMSQKKTMSNVRSEYLDDLREDVNRRKKLHSYTMLADYPTIPFDRPGYFLKKDPEGEYILGETMAAEEGFFRFRSLLDQRNPRYEEMVRVIIQQGRPIVDATNILNQTLVKDVTDSLYKSADDVLKHLDESIRQLDGYLKKRVRKKYRNLR